MRSNRFTVLIDANSSDVILHGAPAIGSRVLVFLTLNLDRGCRQWGYSSRRQALSLSQAGSSLTTFVGRILEVQAVPFMNERVHHVEFLLDCGVPVTAFSLTSARSRTIEAGGYLSGIGHLFGHLDGGGLTLARGIDALVQSVGNLSPDETTPQDDWLTVVLSIDTTLADNR